MCNITKTLLKLNIFAYLFITSMMMYSQDWPNLGRYQKENELLMENPVDSNRVVFMGNSITEGWINLRPEYFKDKPYVNRGIGGQTTPQMLLRFRQDVIDLKPRAVVILAGINDIAENTGPSTLKMITDNIESMVELALANGITVYLCSVLPANNFPWRPQIKPADKVLELNHFLRNLSNQENVIYVDYYSKMVDDNKGLKAELGDDGVHPNQKGYKIMEEVLTNHLTF
ncbi:MAG: SGNH/GDSL hydrolase family protein [Flavobacteriaceae bacterium]|nr:SGNH/GDSL hydrolase family protein [Flavobacteriaceae bacterium]